MVNVWLLNAALWLELVNTAWSILSVADLSRSLPCRSTCHVPDPLSWHSPLNEFVDINDRLKAKTLSLQQWWDSVTLDLSLCPPYHEKVDRFGLGTYPTSSTWVRGLLVTPPKWHIWGRACRSTEGQGLTLSQCPCCYPRDIEGSCSSGYVPSSLPSRNRCPRPQCQSYPEGPIRAYCSC